MNSSNSFNICPRCGNSNSLNAKYCSRCGAQLKVPTEAVVCHKCHTRNSSLANFCRNCGATLKVGAQTKICPRCGREIGAEENMCACGYSFVSMQQTEPKRADVSSTVKEKRRDKKRDNVKTVEQQPSYTETNKTKENKPKQKKSGRGFALFAFLVLAVFVVAIILPASARGGLVNLDKGFYHSKEEAEAPQAVVDTALQLYAEGDENDDVTTPSENEGGENEGGGETEPVTPPTENDEEEEPAPAEKWTVTFKNGDTVVATEEVVKGQKLTAEQIPAAPTAPQGKEFKGWFSGETQITVDTEINGDIIAMAEFTPVSAPPASDPKPDPDPTPNPDPNPTPENPETLEANVYGWDLINDTIKLFTEHMEDMKANEGGPIQYLIDYFGSATFMLVIMLVLFILTAFFHLLVCLARIISPKRSKRPNYLYLILFVITLVISLMMQFSPKIPNQDSGFALFFKPTYNGIECEYGWMIFAIPAYYLFFTLYSCVAKKKMPKKPKKGE